MNNLFKRDNDEFLKIKKSLIEKNKTEQIIQNLKNSRKKIEQDRILENENSFIESKKSGLYFFEIKQKADEKSNEKIDNIWNDLKE